MHACSHGKDPHDQKMRTDRQTDLFSALYGCMSIRMRTHNTACKLKIPTKNDVMQLIIFI